MTARKLTDSEKENILHLYRTTGETSSTLAVKYGVSTSTISRILKSSLPADEYESLIQQKRALRTADLSEVTKAAETFSEPTDSELIDSEPTDAIEEPEPLALEEANTPPESAVEEVVSEVLKTSGREKPVLRSRKPSSAQTTSEAENEAQQLEVPLMQTQPEPSQGRVFEQSNDIEAEVFKEISSEDLITEEDLSELDDELDDDLEDDDEDDEEFGDELSNKPLLARTQLRDGISIQILPLAEAPIPRTCYLVVDRAAELIAPPLREFGDLGQIPEEEIQAKTLPIFDNHRVAKRYSNPRTQRVIKLPDGRVLSKASSHLKDKGITRLLIDGRVYALN